MLHKIRRKLQRCAGQTGQRSSYKKISRQILKRFLGKFLNDESYANIFRNLESGNNEEAFRAAHTLKGICQNLGLDRLFVSANAVTEALRNGKNDVNDEMLAALKADYELTAEAIRSLI